MKNSTMIIILFIGAIFFLPVLVLSLIKDGILFVLGLAIGYLLEWWARFIDYLNEPDDRFVIDPYWNGPHNLI